jgi:predicted acylesterase/phospholipase RssA
VLACYPQIRIDGRWYSDGGLLGALPLWAASELGATRVVAVNVLPKMPSAVVRTAVKTLQRMAPARPVPAPGLEVHRVEPAGGLGSLREAVFWNRSAVERWIARGEADARRLRLE